jgi:hypothetical protein
MSSGFSSGGIDIGGTDYYHSIYVIDKSNSTVVGNATYEGKDIYGAIIDGDVLLYTIEDGVATPIYYNEAVVSLGDWS